MDPCGKRTRITFFIGCLLALSVLLPLWRPILLGLILGYFSEGAVDYLARRFRLQRRGRSLIAAALLVVVLLIFLGPISLGIYAAGRELMQALPNSTVDLGLDAERLSDWLGRWLSNRLARFHVSLSAGILAELGPRLQQGASAAVLIIGAWLRGLLGATPHFLFDLMIVLVTWWLASFEGSSQRERLLRWFLPWPQPRAILDKAVTDVLRGLIVSNLAVAAIQATICTIGLAVLRIPHAFSLGVLSLFLAFVPVVGTATVTVGAAIYLFAQGRIGAGLAMLVIALVAGTVDNLLRPFFLRGQMELSVSWIFLSIVGGIATFGAVGIVLGPIVISICQASLRALEAEAQTPEGPPSVVSRPPPPPAEKPTC